MTTPPKVCSRPECTQRSRARGMCKNHYHQWHHALKQPLESSTSRVEILAAMPGTIAEIAAACGMKRDTVNKAVKRMHAKGEVHIENVEPPSPGIGRRWLDVFAAGPGVDAKASKAMKRKHAAARVRNNYASKKAAARIDPLMHFLYRKSPSLGVHP